MCRNGWQMLYTMQRGGADDDWKVQHTSCELYDIEHGGLRREAMQDAIRKPIGKRQMEAGEAAEQG